MNAKYNDIIKNGKLTLTHPLYLKNPALIREDRDTEKKPWIWIISYKLLFKIMQLWKREETYCKGNIDGIL